MKKICPKCKKEFVCSHDASCFCMKYRLSNQTADYLKKTYDNCLCEECLKQYADKQPNG
ncbi:MAG: cysteine-rich CWC family protein [Bacteroidales bacterium]|nr:cysteine-rich CWC family protein [Bacteroidales bacterium]